MNDQFTDSINAENVRRWKAQASQTRTRLAMSMGVCPDGSLQMYLAQQVPPETIVKMLRTCADSIEAKSTGRIIIPA